MSGFVEQHTSDGLPRSENVDTAWMACSRRSSITYVGTRPRPAARGFALQLLSITALAMFASLPCVAQDEPLSEYVNTLRGSDSTPYYSHGNTFPAVALPFGASFWTPVTKANSSMWLYEYSSPTIQGFALSHEPSPWVGDYASFQVVPMIGAPLIDPVQRAEHFEHVNEVARAHYYRVFFTDSGIQTEIAPTAHCGMFRFMFPDATPAVLLFDSIDEASGAMTAQPGDTSISGHVDQRGQRIYFHARVDRAIQRVIDPDGGGVNLAIELSAPSGLTKRQVTLAIGTSYISVEQARANLAQEVAGSSFDDIRSAAQRAWDKQLGKITIDVASDAERITFYSSLYRAFLYPNEMSESVAGRLQHYDPFSMDVRDGPLYVNNGFWDTYRAAWPLYVLLMPHRAGEMLDGFVNAYKAGGWIPRWSGPGYADIMVGTHSDIVLADAYVKGVRNFDADAAFESMLKNALVFSADGARGRKGNARSIFRGYIPLEDAAESAAWHLEDCINDFGIARMAELRGDAVHAAYFLARSRAYSNLFSSSLGFFRGRYADGRFRTEDATFHPNEWGFEFTEGNAWHYIAAANHDPEGLMALYGGADAFARKLDQLILAPRDFMTGSYGDVIHEMREAYDVNMGQYAHANEPVHHLLYMFDYAHQPASTQRLVREVLSPDRLIYGAGVGDGRGYLGDEDNGQMSAWYVFSALGFYPAAAGWPEYAIGSPSVRSAALHLENGRSFRVTTHDNAADHPYIQTALLNGRPLNRPFIQHADVLGGAELELWMGPMPSNWGTAATQRAAAHESHLEEPLRDCARGGVVRADGEDGDLAFDDDSASSWLCTASTGALEYALPVDTHCRAGLYTLTSGAGSPERDPMAWRIEGSMDGVEWTTLDQRADESFAWRRQTRVFALRRTGLYRLYRLVITHNHGASSTELAELELLAERSASASSPVHSTDGVWSYLDSHSSPCGIACALLAGLATMLASWGFAFSSRRRSDRRARGPRSELNRPRLRP